MDEAVHDLRNLLFGIDMLVEAALQDVTTQLPARDFLEPIHRACRDARELCRNVLAQGDVPHHSSAETEELQLAEFLEEMEPLLQAIVPETVRLSCDTDPHLPSVKIDQGQLSRVVLNLVKNAVEALTGRPGWLVLKTGVEVVTERVDTATAFQPGSGGRRYTYLEVADNGCGMDETRASSLFRGRHTTKASGHGLGLLSVDSIIRGHGGMVKVRSRPAGGTAVRVLLPCASSPSGHGRLRAQRPEEARQADGKASLLLVDDDRGPRDIAKRVLGSLGFAVDAVCTGREALTTVLDQPDRFSLVLLDRVLPDMDGADVLGRLRTIQPELPVVLTSGHRERDLLNRLRDGVRPDAYLQKPFGIDELLDCIDRVLAHRAGRGGTDATQGASARAPRTRPPRGDKLCGPCVTV